MRVHALIPARLESTRLPRKLLLDETGIPLIAHTANSLRRAGVFDSIRVVADSCEIIAALKGKFAWDLTPEGITCRNGTERIAEHVLRNPDIYQDGDLILNVQADEPCLQPHHFQALIDCWKECPAADVVTPVRPLRIEDRENETVVKAALTQNDEVVHFSRWLHPQFPAECYFEHVGVYAFGLRYLQWYQSCDGSDRGNDLEQLRLQDARFVAVILRDYDGTSVNTAEDYQQFVEWHRKRTAEPVSQ